jgi:hypothetical protein
VLDPSGTGSSINGGTGIENSLSLELRSFAEFLA